MKLNQINIGLAIEQRLNELGISKSEFGRRIGIQQQNVNRIIDKESIDTDKLKVISEALDCNFFSLFCSEESPTTNTANNGSIALSGNNTTGDIHNGGESIRVKDLEQLVEQMKSQLADKERLIQILMEK